MSVNPKLLPTLLPFNIDFTKIFKNNNPLDLEIGCGRPHFFFDRAKNFPNRNIIGIEYKYEFMYQAQKRIVRENLTNALALHANAWVLTPLLFKNSSIENIFVNFADPWWKERHKKRLVLNEDFLVKIKPLLVPKGKIIVQTDVLELFQHYHDLLLKNGFKNLPWPHEEIKDFCQAINHREKKCLENNAPIYRGAFELIGMCCL